MSSSLYSPLGEERPENPSNATRNPFKRTRQVAIFGSLAVAIGVVCVVALVITNASDDSNLSNTAQLISRPASTAHLREAIPSEFAVSYVPPYKSQEHRGTCWIFATVALLEHAYRKQGIEQGLLHEDAYVQFSEQAFGSIMMDLCRENHERCVFAGDRIGWGKTASGGETALLAYFGTDLGNKVVPTAVCPYWPDDDGHDHECPGLQEALSNNPVSFKIKSWYTYYTVESIKQALYRTGHAMGISIPTHKTVHYIPCVGTIADSTACAKDEKTKQCPTPCPAGKKFFPSECCVATETSMYNTDGEFYAQDHIMIQSGGHAMLVVGYSDSYTTRNGDRGGFIIRNSWSDGFGETGARGHHSIKYFTQEHSETDERDICPNAYSPWSWYVCDRPPCTNEFNIASAKEARQPREMRCQDKTKCDTSEDAIYFLKSIDEYMESGMHKVCFLKYSAKSGEATPEGDFCLEPQMISTVVLSIRPSESETVKENDHDACGYYFLPYRLAEQIKSRFGMFFVNDFDITFTPESYVAHSDHSDRYSLLEKSSKVQKVPTFDGPFPGKATHLN